MTLFRSFSFFYLCMKSSTKLHNKMLTKIVYASMFFFNTNPSGRILNRFSKDMGAIDEWLPLSFGLALQVSMLSLILKCKNKKCNQIRVCFTNACRWQMQAHPYCTAFTVCVFGKSEFRYPQGHTLL